MSYHFAFSYCSWGSQGKNTEVACHSLLQWTTFCQTSPPWPDRLGWPHSAWLSVIELDKTVVLWADWLVFCDDGFSGSAVWCPLPIPTVLLRFLLPWTWGISSQLLQQSAAAAPYLGRGMSPHRYPSWPCLATNMWLIRVKGLFYVSGYCGLQQNLLKDVKLNSIFDIRSSERQNNIKWKSYCP